MCMYYTHKRPTHPHTRNTHTHMCMYPKLFNINTEKLMTRAYAEINAISASLFPAASTTNRTTPNPPNISLSYARTRSCTQPRIHTRINSNTHAHQRSLIPRTHTHTQYTMHAMHTTNLKHKQLTNYAPDIQFTREANLVMCMLIIYCIHNICLMYIILNLYYIIFT